MRKILFGVLLTLAILFIARSCYGKREKQAVLTEQSELIQERITQVSKLIVTEGHFAEIYNYKDSQKLFGSLITADKKALVVVNAEVNIIYDLKKLTYQLETDNKTLRITHIPEPEIQIIPDLEYYDVSADYLNPFGAEDYNRIKQQVNTALRAKIEASSLRKNAQNRLLTELSSFLVLTETLGWTLLYEEKPIQTQGDFLEFND